MKDAASKQPLSASSEAELQQHREAIRRELLRTNTAAVTVLLVVLGLALGAVVHTNRAEKERVRAVAAERQARENLWQAYLAQARSSRASNRAGRRFDSLDALRLAAQMRPALELREEAAACLALADLRVIHPRFAAGRMNVSLSPDFEQYACAGPGGTIELRRMADDQRLVELPAQANSIGWVHHLSPDGRFLPVRYHDGWLRVWNLAEGRIVLEVPTAHLQIGVDFSADSRRLAVVDDTGALLIYEVASGKIFTRHRALSGVTRIRFSPDGRALAVCSETDSTARVLNIDDGKVLTELPHGAGIRNVSWSPDGQVVVTSGDDGRACLWRISEQKAFLVLPGHQAAVIEAEFHPNGLLLASASWDGLIRLWDVATGELCAVLARTGNILRFTRDGRYLSFYWENGQHLHLCEVASQLACRLLSPSHKKDPDPVAASSTAQLCVSFSPDGRVLASGHIDGFRLWDVDRLCEINHVPGAPVRSVFFDSSGSSLYSSGDGGFFKWGVEQLCKTNETTPIVPETLARGWCHRAAMAPDGSEIAHIQDGKLHLHRSRRVLDSFPHTTFLAFSPDSRWLAASAWHKEGGRIWEWRQGRVIRDFAQGASLDIRFSPDNQWLILAGSEEYSFQNVHTGQAGKSIERTNAAAGCGFLAFTDDGTMMACIRSRTQIQLIDTRTFERLVTLEVSPSQTIGGLAFNPSGTKLVAATGTPALQFWDLVLLKKGLAETALDWPPRLPDSNPSLTKPEFPKPAGGSRRTFSIALALGGAALAILLGLSILNHQRRLVRSHHEIDQLAMQRSQQLEHARRELAHNEKMKALGTLATGIAHDFNNLLSVIRMGNNLAHRRNTSPQDRQESNAAIERAVQQGKNLIRSMLGYSRDHGQVCQYSIVKLVEDTVGLLTKQFLSGITLLLELDSQVPALHGARGELEQILLNLIVNASEAMDGRGTLRIAVGPASPTGHTFVLRPQPAQGYVELVVSDSGPGIAPELQSRIFEPFFSTKSFGTTRGTGLGLSLVYSLAQKNGFGLALQSSPDRGTTFRLFLPANPVQVDAGAQEIPALNSPVCSTSTLARTQDPS